MKLPKLNLITAGDDLRPAMNHVYVDETHVVASDSHVIATFSRSLIDDCIPGLPEKFFIEDYQWKVLTTEFARAEYDENSNIIILTNKKGVERFLRIKEADMVEFKYPDYTKVIPPTTPKTPVDSIGLNTKVLSRFLSVIPHHIMALEFRGCVSGILVTCPDSSHDFVGMIMPAVVSQ